MHPHRAICLYLASTLIAQPLAFAGSGIRVDPAAAHSNRPGLDTAPNGVPLVQIAPPTDRGVSHNRYSAFNVSRQGLILNNSRATAQTQLGGFVPGNPNLRNGEARIILNEVTGAQRSSLRGYTEVAGRAAEVVIANPYGITCNGCGFINTPRATLTTGRPELTNGALSGFDVRGGDVALEGAGLNAANVDRLDIIARAVALNAKLHAKDLSIVTGPNRVDYQSLATTPGQGDPQTPAFSLDASTLGGMYADRIRLVGTEQGVGVNLPAELAAGSGGLQVTADGGIRLGHSVSQGEVAITSSGGDIHLADTLYSARSLDIRARDRVRTGDGLVGARDRIRIQARSLDNDHARMIAGLERDGDSNARGRLVIDTSERISNRGTLLATGSGVLRTRSLDNAGPSARVASLGALAIHTEHLDNGSGQIQAGGDLALTATGGLLNRGGELQAGGGLQVRTQGRIDNRSGRIAAGAGLQIEGQLGIQNRDGELLSEGGIALDGGRGSIDNTRGEISAAGDLAVTTDHDVHNASGALVSGQNIRLRAGGALDNTGGETSAAETLTLDVSGKVTNASGTLSSGQGLDVHTGGMLDNRAGRIEAQAHAALEVAEGLSNRRGLILATGALHVENIRGGLDNAQGVLTTAGDLRMATQGDIDNAEGLLGASGTLLVETRGDLHNGSGQVLTLADATLRARRIHNDEGELLAGGRLDLGVQAFANSGVFGASGGLAITSAGAIVNGAGLELYSAGDLSLHAGTAVTNLGTISTAGGLAVHAASLSNSAEAQLLSSEDAELNIAGALENWGRIHTDRDLGVSADSVTNAGGLSAAQDLGIASRELSNRGIVFAGRDMTLFTTGSLSNLPGANLLSMGDLAIAADSGGARTTRVLNESATIEAYDGSLRISAVELTNQKEAFAIATHTVSQTTVTLEPDTLRYTEEALLAIVLSEHPELDESDLRHRECDIGSGCGSLRYTPLARDLFAEILDREAEPYAAQGYEVSQGLYSGPVGGSGDLEAPYYFIELRIPAPENHETTRWISTTITEDRIEQDSPAGKVLSGRDLEINAAMIRNDLGLIASSGDIGLRGGGLENTGRDLVRTTTRDITRAHRDKHPFRSDDKWYTYDHEEAREVIDSRYGTIQAGGRLSGDFTGAIDNRSIRQGGGPIGLMESTALPDAIGIPTKDSRETPRGDLDAKRLTLTQPTASQRPRPRRVFDPTVSSDIQLPEGDHGLFVTRAEPDHPYLVETNPQFTQLRHLLGSDYLLARLGIDPGQTIKRVGDGLYESRLVRDAAFYLTGRRYLGEGIESDTDQLRYLMDNAVQVQSEMALQLGVRLSSEQIDALSRDILWLEEREIAGQRVLAPVVYLAAVQGQDLDKRGARILARDIDLAAEGGIDNRGGLVAKDDLALLSAGDINNLGGMLGSGGDLTALAHNTIRNRSGSIRGGTLTMMARDGDVILERATRDIQSRYNNGTIERTALGDPAIIEARQALVISAGRDALTQGARLSAGDDLDLSARRDIRMESVIQTRRHGFDLGVGHDRAERTVNLGSETQAAGDLRLSAGRDITLDAAQLEGTGDVILNAKRDMRLLAAKDRESADRAIETRDLVGGRSSEDRRERETVVATRVQAGRDLLINATPDESAGMSFGSGRHVEIAAAGLSAGRDAVIRAGEDLTLSAESYTRLEHRRSTQSGLVGAQERRHTTADTRLAGTFVNTGRDALLLGGQDLQVLASDIQAGRDAVLSAGLNGQTGSLHIRSGAEARAVIDERRKIRIDLKMSDGLLSFASDARRLEEHARETNRAASIGAGRDIELTAQRELDIVGSRAEATRNARLKAGRELTILAAAQATVDKIVDSETRIGVGGTLNLNESSLFAGALARRDGVKHDTRLNAASRIVAGNDLRIEAGDQITQMGSHMGAAGDIELRADRIQSLSEMDQYHSKSSTQKIRTGIQIGVEQHLSDAVQAAQGIVQSTSNPLNAAAASLKAVDAVDSTIMNPVSAGLDFVAEMELSESETRRRLASPSHIEAGGDIRIIAGDELHLQGTQVKGADDIILRTGGELLIDSAQGTIAQDDKTSQADIQVSLYGTKQGQVDTSLNRSRQENARVFQNNARITAANSLRIESSADTTVSGALLTARHTELDVGGDLLVASRQDTGRVKGKRRDLSVTTNGGGGAGRGRTSGQSAWVGEQTRILGRESLSASIGGHTAIDGAVIASLADDLHLETGSLTYQDVQDKDKTISKDLSLGSGHGGKIEASYSSQNREQVSRATIGAGTIIVRDTPNQELSGLNRDLGVAQETTRDDGEGLNLYASRGSVTKASSPFQTLQDWKTQQALTGIRMYKEVRENLPESETLETLSTLTGGLTPSRDNHGGFITQLPALVFGDMQFFKAVARLQKRLDAEGKSIYELSDFEILYRITAPEQGTSVAANGIQNTLPEALRNGAMQTGDRDLSMAYNPEHGMIGDLLESGWDKAIGGIVRSGNARQFHDFWQKGVDNGYTGRAAAHSQAGLLLYRALKGISFNPKKGDVMFQFNGTPVNTRDLENTVDKAGGKWKGHNINYGDPIANVPVFLGGNARSGKELLDSIVQIPNLFDSTKSPHSDYFCTGDFCAGKQPALK